MSYIESQVKKDNGNTPKLTCQTCYNWVKQPLSPDQGACHRFPPYPILMGPQLAFLFPHTTKNDTCGEYEKKGVLLDN